MADPVKSSAPKEGARALKVAAVGDLHVRE
ncbi:metallophosphoesterase, partial [Mesorhizobium sp. M7A.T.Ca.TU.009.01.3.1]